MEKCSRPPTSCITQLICDVMYVQSLVCRVFQIFQGNQQDVPKVISQSWLIQWMKKINHRICYSNPGAWQIRMLNLDLIPGQNMFFQSFSARLKRQNNEHGIESSWILQTWIIMNQFPIKIKETNGPSGILPRNYKRRLVFLDEHRSPAPQEWTYPKLEDTQKTMANKKNNGWHPAHGPLDSNYG